MLFTRSDWEDEIEKEFNVFVSLIIPVQSSDQYFFYNHFGSKIEWYHQTKWFNKCSYVWKNNVIRKSEISARSLSSERKYVTLSNRYDSKLRALV